MSLNVNGQNAACDGYASAFPFSSLHTGDPSTSGANEATGGSPAYARLGQTWASAASGQRLSTGTPTFDIPAGTYYFVGKFSLVTGGNFGGYAPLGGKVPQSGNALATGDTITKASHGLSNGLRVVVFDIQAAGVPAGLTEGTVYFVVGVSGATFQVSLTSGGAAVDITADGPLGFQECVPETFVGQGKLLLPAGADNIDFRFV